MLNRCEHVNIFDKKHNNNNIFQALLKPDLSTTKVTSKGANTCNTLFVKNCEQVKVHNVLVIHLFLQILKYATNLYWYLHILFPYPTAPPPRTMFTLLQNGENTSNSTERLFGKFI